MRSRSVTALTALALCLVGCAPGPADPAPAPTSIAPPAPSTPAPSRPRDPITGTEPSTNPVIAVKVENTAAARPQVGLDVADLVVVEEVEAGITRLIAVYHSSFPSRVGPVRSARNTDARLLPMFGRPGLVYSGANGKVAEQLAKASLVRIERSDRDRTRPAPHNVMVDLASLTTTRGLGPVQDIGLTFAEEDPARSNARAADASAKVGQDKFTFDHDQDGYTPHWQGKPYDGDVRADNVVILQVRNRKDTDTTSSLSVVSETVGQGRADVHRDGTVRTGTWRRDAVDDGLRLVDDSGDDLPLAPGRTWILLVGR